MECSIEDEDPLTLALQPPPDETYDQRRLREEADVEAKRVSDEIDEQIRKERRLERLARPVKVLLLGQSGSGKTTTVKNFQLIYARREWSEERATWRQVIFLNLVRNVNTILDHLTSIMSDLPHNPDVSQEDSAVTTVPGTVRPSPRLNFTEQHRQLKLRLAPLVVVQNILEQTLGSASLESSSTAVKTAAAFEQPAPANCKVLQEFSINSSNGLNSSLCVKQQDTVVRQESDIPASTTNRTREIERSDEDVAEVIASCREDIKALWDNDVVQEMLNRKNVQLGNAPGFFITESDRICTREYQPTDDDVIRARLRTLGVQEYRFLMDRGLNIGQEWRLYDVGGTRSSREAWYPYFDDVDAIMFHAPISPFDETLAEDHRVTRLEDSYLLWRSVCSCKLLAQTQIILVLNKCDLLKAKLHRGVRIRDSVPSFGDRENDFSTASRYFRQHFKEISRKYSPVPRSFYVHLTSVIDTHGTAFILSAVNDCILREHLRRAELI